MLEQLASEQDVWGFLDTIENRYRVPPQQRQHFYEMFIALVATRPRAEQDALISRGAGVFHYRMDTARRDVAALGQSSGSAVKIQATVVDDSLIAEIIHQPGEQATIKYLVYREGQEPEIADRVTIGPVTYMPPQTRLVELGCLKLPTAAEDYGDVGDLFRNVRYFIKSYVHLGSAQYLDIASFYVMLSWVFDRFPVVPYLRLRGDLGTGKTTGIECIGSICFRGIFAGGATTAAPIFRILDRFHGTLVLDEGDYSERSEIWGDMNKILNVGNRRAFPILRAERKGQNEQFDTEAYDCYSPKLISTRRDFPDDALESRCLTHTMTQNGLPRTMPLYFDDTFHTEAQELRNQLLMFRCRMYRHAVADPRERFDDLDARSNQILIPLLSIASDAAMRNAILDHARRHQVQFREGRRESPEGKVAGVLLECWQRRPAQRDEVLLRSVNERIEQKYGESERIKAKTVGKIVRGALGLETTRAAGMVWIRVTQADIHRLIVTYALVEDEPAVPSRVAVQQAPPAAHVREPMPRVNRQPVAR